MVAKILFFFFLKSDDLDVQQKSIQSGVSEKRLVTYI